MLSLRWEKSPAMCRIQHFLRKKAIWKRIRIPCRLFVNALQRGMEKGVTEHAGGNCENDCTAVPGNGRSGADGD